MASSDEVRAPSDAKVRQLISRRNQQQSTQVGARSFIEWREMIDASHRTAGYHGLSVEGLELLRTISGNESP